MVSPRGQSCRYGLPGPLFRGKSPTLPAFSPFSLQNRGLKKLKILIEFFLIVALSAFPPIPHLYPFQKLPWLFGTTSPKYSNSENIESHTPARFARKSRCPKATRQLASRENPLAVMLSKAGTSARFAGKSSCGYAMGGSPVRLWGVGAGFVLPWLAGVTSHGHALWLF